MVSMRSDPTRARQAFAGDGYPVPDDAEFRRLRELCNRLYSGGRATRGWALAGIDEMISDAVARDYFARTLLRIASHRKR